MTMARRTLPLLWLAAALWSAPVLADDAMTNGIGGPFALTDQNGNRRTEADPDDRAQLLFFGYIKCQGICSAALPTMAEVSDILSERGLPVTPVIVTVDPARDRVETMADPLAVLGPDFVGLTGTPEDLQVAYEAFSVSFEEVAQDSDGAPIYSHGSFIYVLDKAGNVLNVLPPVLPPDHMASIIAANLAGAG